jgi:hypothetical protein
MPKRANSGVSKSGKSANGASKRAPTPRASPNSSSNARSNITITSHLLFFNNISDVLAISSKLTDKYVGITLNVLVFKIFSIIVSFFKKSFIFQEKYNN